MHRLRLLLSLLLLIARPVGAMPDELQPDNPGAVTTAPEAGTPEAGTPEAGTPEAGTPLLRHYHPREYASVTPFVDNWSILQDQRGRLVIGNSAGVLLYNGNLWRFVETPDKSIVRWLAKDPAGRIFVGASDDLGYLTTDPSGRTQFYSLLPQLSTQYRHFGDIRSVCATAQGIYFLTSRYLFRWHANRFQYWHTRTSFSYMGQSEGRLFVQESGLGLYELDNGQLQLLSDAAPFRQTLVKTVFTSGNGQLLVGTLAQGLFRIAGGVCTPLTAEANPYLIEHSLYHGIRLPDDNYALATLRGGILIMDTHGRIRQIIDKESGLGSNSVHHLCTDDQGGLWAATGNGLCRIEILSPFSLFDERNGLVGNIQELRRYRGRLYAGTSAGLYVLQTGPGKRARFEPVPNFADGVLRLFLFDDQMLIAGKKHLYQLDGNQLSILKSNFRVAGLHRSRRDPSLLFLSSDGLHAMRRIGASWREEGQVPGIYEDIHTVTETPSGDLYLATRWQGALRVQFPATTDGQITGPQLKQPAITRFGKEQGLPPGVNRFYWVGRTLYLRIGEEDSLHLFRLDEARGTFGRVEHLGKELGLRNGRVYPAGDTLSANWWWTQYPADRKWSLTQLIPESEGTTDRRNYNLNRIAEYGGKSIYREGDSVVWLRGMEGVVRYHLRQGSSVQQPYQTLLERVLIGADSSLYPNASITGATLPYRLHTLRFDFIAPSYEQPQENEFQYRLEGYDENWSDWSRETYKEYTRIPQGDYVFRVRSRNLYGSPGGEASFAVVIQPPWYGTWLMYGVYALLLTGTVYGIVSWRSTRLRAEKAALEKIVLARTREIAQQNQQLEEQARQLASQTQQLRELDELKSNFFANISHEFRTPLTLILGTLNDKLNWLRRHPESTETPVKAREIGVMHRNANRLLQLISQLLDLSKVESGYLQPQWQVGDLSALLRVIAASFTSLAEHRNICFGLVLPAQPLPTRFDPDQIEKIFYNLLSNAFKFTPEGGEITLEVSLPESKTREVQITVQDSGIGIPAGQVDRVFDRFFQGAHAYPGDGYGTGIGLALTRELVHLHGGQIRAESEPGRGARFTVRLPLLSQEQAVALPALPTSSPWMETLPPDLPVSEADASQPVSTDERQALILVVEDHADLRQYIRAQLDQTYRVLESEDGLQGWEKALEQQPDLIISDWMMPRLTGVELCSRLKSDERTSHIPFILLTAVATRQGKLTGLEGGADDYLTKPFDAAELELRVRNLLESRRKMRERFGREIRVQPTDIAVTSVDEQFLRRVMQIVETHLGDSGFSAEQFGREVGLSRMQLHRKLVALTGQSASDFIRTIRLKRAAQLLEAQAAGTVSEIAFRVGFESLSYFSKSFREQFGVLPTEYVARQPIPPR